MFDPNLSQLAKDLIDAIEETDNKLAELKELANKVTLPVEQILDLDVETAKYATYRYYADIHTDLWEVMLEEITIKAILPRDQEVTIHWYCDRDGERIAYIPVSLWLTYQKSWREQNGWNSEALELYQREEIEYDEYLHYVTGYLPRW